MTKDNNIRKEIEYELNGLDITFHFTPRKTLISTLKRKYKGEKCLFYSYPCLCQPSVSPTTFLTPHPLDPMILSLSVLVKI